MKITKKVQTRLFLKYDIEQGDRQIKKYRTGRWKSWDRREVMLDNVREAVKYVTDKMQKEHIGGIVVIRPVVNGHSLPKYSNLSPEWKRKQKGFVARHLVQYKKNPTYRRRLALIAWSYDPEKH